VTKYLSDTIVNGFTCGAAFHVIVSQIATLLGIKLKGIHIPFVVIGVCELGIIFN
jgi:MFS superfamily sulfate permease-like transporter